MPDGCDSIEMNLHVRLDMLQMSQEQIVHMIAWKLQMTAISSGGHLTCSRFQDRFCMVVPPHALEGCFPRASSIHSDFMRPTHSPHLHTFASSDKARRRVSKARSLPAPSPSETGKTSWSCTAATYSKMKSWKNVGAEKCLLWFLELSYFTESWQETLSTIDPCSRDLIVPAHVFQFARWCTFLRRNLQSFTPRNTSENPLNSSIFSKFDYTIYSHNLISYYIIQVSNIIHIYIISVHLISGLDPTNPQIAHLEVHLSIWFACTRSWGLTLWETAVNSP